MHIHIPLDASRGEKKKSSSHDQQTNKLFNTQHFSLGYAFI